MLIYKKEYDLPDYSIITTKKLLDFKLWQPSEMYIVLGKSDTVDKSVNKTNSVAVEQKIYIVKRPSGGHSVILSPKTVVVSVISRDVSLRPKQIFGGINRIIVAALQKLSIDNLVERGISDIAIGDKKILGSSIYKNKNYCFYHAVLNFSESSELINNWLLPPGTEPEYRRQRSHTEFVTSICHYNNKLTIEQVMRVLREEFSKNLTFEYLRGIVGGC